MKTDITIEGKEYQIDLDKAKELGIISEKFVPKKIGSKYRWRENIYILATPTKSDVVLINVESGFRFSEPVHIGLPKLYLDESQWEKVRDGEDMIEVTYSVNVD